MPKQLSPEVEGAIRAFSKASFSYRNIQKLLPDKYKPVSIGTISAVLNNKGTSRKALNENRKFERNQRPSTSRKPELINKIKKEVNRKNPPTLRALSSIYGVSHTVIRRIIKEYIGKDKRVKQSVNVLTESA